MKNAEAIKTLVETDSTATHQERMAVLAALDPKESKRRVIPITTKEAADLIGCHVITLRRYEKLGLIKLIRYNARRIRWDRNEVERFIAEGATHQDSEAEAC